MPTLNIRGDILSLGEGEILLHICDATSEEPKGAVAIIFNSFPFANTYNGFYKVQRNIGIITSHHRPGSPIIINVYSQKNPGKAGNGETSDDRLCWFRGGLAQVRALFPGRDINVPYNIGCGAIGGKWKDYLRALEEHAFIGRTNLIIYTP